jgi:hypothetical protein
MDQIRQWWVVNQRFTGANMSQAINITPRNFNRMNLLIALLFIGVFLSECGGGDPHEEEKHNRRHRFEMLSPIRNLPSIAN